MGTTSAEPFAPLLRHRASLHFEGTAPRRRHAAQRWRAGVVPPRACGSAAAVAVSFVRLARPGDLAVARALARERATSRDRALGPLRAGRAARRADRAMHNTRQRRQLEASLLRCTAVFRRASSGLPCQASSASRVAQKPLRSLLLRRWRSTRACRVCAPRCATCDWFMHMFGPLHHARPLHPREASILRCTAALRCASCGRQRQACAASRVAQAPLRSLSLGRRRSARAIGARGPLCAAC